MFHNAKAKTLVELTPQDEMSQRSQPEALEDSWRATNLQSFYVGITKKLVLILVKKRSTSRTDELVRKSEGKNSFIFYVPLAPLLLGMAQINTRSSCFT